MPIISPDHYTVRSRDIDASWKFYEDVLGLRVRKREGMPVPAFIVSIWPDRQARYCGATRSAIHACESTAVPCRWAEHS